MSRTIRGDPTATLDGLADLNSVLLVSPIELIDKGLNVSALISI